eukprot:9120897-Pyramimonas_sp.AAC.1
MGVILICLTQDTVPPFGAEHFGVHHSACLVYTTQRRLCTPQRLVYTAVPVYTTVPVYTFMPVYTTADVCTTTPVYTRMLVHTTGPACTTTHDEHLRHNAAVNLQGPGGPQIWTTLGARTYHIPPAL